MAGEAAARGISQLAGTDSVRNLPAQLDDMLDDLAILIPYRGITTAAAVTGGFITVTHGLGFTPTAVFVQSRTNQFVCHVVDTLTSTTFRTRWAKFQGSSPSFTLADAATTDTVGFSWAAYR